jgi:hypothetical protein
MKKNILIIILIFLVILFFTTTFDQTFNQAYLTPFLTDMYKNPLGKMILNFLQKILNMIFPSNPYSNVTQP